MRKRLIIIIITTFTLAFKWFLADVTVYRLDEWVRESWFNAAQSVFEEWFDFNVCFCVFRKDIYCLQSDNPVRQNHLFSSITTRVVTELCLFVSWKFQFGFKKTKRWKLPTSEATVSFHSDFSSVTCASLCWIKKVKLNHYLLSKTVDCCEIIWKILEGTLYVWRRGSVDIL